MKRRISLTITAAVALVLFALPGRAFAASFPVAVNDTATVYYNHSINQAAPGVLANDSDPDGLPLTVTSYGSPAHGTSWVGADGAWSYTPETGYTGSDQFSYAIGNGAFYATADVFISVTNAAPVTPDHTYSVHAGNVLSVPAPGVWDGVYDPDGDAMTLYWDWPSNGGVEGHPDGSFDYWPALDFVGQDAFSYMVQDAVNASSSGQVIVNVTNTPPTGADHSYSAVSGQMLSVNVPGLLVGAADPEGDPVESAIVSQPSHGTLSSGPSGWFDYTAAADYSGPDSFTFLVRDHWQTGPTYTATINVSAPNHNPVGVADSYTVHAGSPLTIAAPGVLANDTDPDGDPLSVLTVMNYAQHGSLSLNGDGGFTYTPGAGYVGPDAFDYVVTDGRNGAGFGHVTLAVNDAPPVVFGASFTVPSDGKLDVPAPGLLTGAFDPDGDPFWAQYEGQPSHGSLAINSDGSFTYYPYKGYVGPDSFTFTARDQWAESAPGTISINVFESNHPPVAVDDNYTVHTNKSLYILAPGLLANDTDPDSDAVDVTETGWPLYGSLTYFWGGSFLYTPSGWYTGIDSFTYTISDGRGGTATATAYINVVNDPPTAEDLEFTTPNNVALNDWPGFLTGARDTETDAISGTVTGLPTHGTLVWQTYGEFTYTPEAGYVGDDSFTYVPYDWNSQGLTHTVTVHVTEANQAPVAVDDTYTVHAGQTLTLDGPGPLANDFDPDGDAIHAWGFSTWPAHGTAWLAWDGWFSYTPDPGFVGVDFFVYAISDPYTTNEALITINVTNAAPTALDSSYSTMAGTSLVVDPPGFLTGAADSDGDAITAAVVDLPTHGEFKWGAEGQFTYTPAKGWVGDDSFTFTANDPFSASALHTVKLHVLSPDKPPVAEGDSYTARKNNVLTVGAPGVLANDSDPNGDAMTAVLVGGVSHGRLTLNANGSFTYTPTRGYAGPDSFTYKVLANGASSKTVTVALTVIVPKK